MLNPLPPAGQVPEILAPAGGPEQFYAALRSGADAVYLGLQNFNARRRATNFTVEDLKFLVPEAHAFGMKVLVTVNVVIKQMELRPLIHILAGLEEVGVDAIIVQDLGVVALCRKYFPGLRLHASTQMAVHNLEGVKFAASHGLKRIVLARELSLTELKRIRAGVSRDVAELESFCHGSLCYSYSGLCFFSGAEDARSGNRGECAYTCREPYKIVSEPGQGFLFSMRDLDSSDQVEKFVEAGIDCLKIEGRKKDAQYVSSVVQLYRDRLDKALGFPTLRPNAPAEAHALRQGFDPESNRSDLSLSYSRRTTSLFTRGRYHENVIDLDNPTHLGLFVGRISKVVDREWAEVCLEQPLERFDGLKLEQESKVFHAKPQDGTAVAVSAKSLREKYDNLWLQFSLRDMKRGKTQIVTAEPKETVWIRIPDSTDLRPGLALYKVRSVQLKQRVEKISKIPARKPVAWRNVDLEWNIEKIADGVTLSVCAKAHHKMVARQQTQLVAETRREGSDLRADLQAMFQQFGDYGIKVDKQSFVGDFGWFLPRSQLKVFKRNLAVRVDAGLASWQSEKLALALESIGPSVRSIGTGKASLTVKCDRLEIAEAVLGGEHHVDRLLLEPKRTFIASKPLAVLRDLVTRCIDRRVKFGLAIPTVVRAWDQPYLGMWLDAAKEIGVDYFEVGNPGAAQWLAERGLDQGSTWDSDFTLYALNHLASTFWGDIVDRVTLSIEDDLQNLTAHLGHWHSRATPQVILYKDTPLFIAESCSLTALHNGCPTSKVCGYRNLEVENSQGERFVVAHEACKSVVYANRPYSITKHRAALEQRGVLDFRVDFLTRPYRQDEISEVLGAALRGGETAVGHDANFSRVLL